MIRDSRVAHALLGNDAPPWAVAFARGLLGALLTGGISFFGVWAQTEDVRLLVTSFMVPFMSYLMLRFGLEGSVDNSRRKR